LDILLGFNPGDESIEKLMAVELGHWYGEEMKFEYASDLSFDIDDFFETHGFPELRAHLERHFRLSGYTRCRFRPVPLRDPPRRASRRLIAG